MKTRRTSRLGERQGRAANTRQAERRGQREQALLPTQLFQQIGEDIYKIGNDLREPIAHLTRNVVDNAFSVAKAVTRNVGDLIENVLDETDRAATNLTRRAKRVKSSVAEAVAD